MKNNSLKKKIKNEAYGIVLWQLIGIVAIACLMALFTHLAQGASVLAGGLAYGLPNLVFVGIVFNYVGAQQTAQFMAAFFLGEVIKLILSAILFLLVVKYLPVSLSSVLTGFLGAIIIFWIVCMRHFSTPKTSGSRG